MTMPPYMTRMLFLGSSIVLFILATCIPLHAADEDPAPAQAAVQPAVADPDSPSSRLNRIDFGNTYIIGQSIKSGAVYLLQRKKSEIKSMLKYREDYRQEILEGFNTDGDKGAAVEAAPGKPTSDSRGRNGNFVSQE
jgi:hypothetical protein